MNEKNAEKNQLDSQRENLREEGFGWAMYCFPGTQKIDFTAGKVSSSSIGNKPSPSFIIAPFHSLDNKFWQIQTTINTSIELGSNDNFLPNLPFYFNPENTKSTSKTEYCKHVETILTDINSGNLVKSVPARVKHVPKPQNFSPFDFFNLLLKAYPNAFVYILSTKETGTWIGCSPELLLKVKGESIKTLSLAGTKKIEDGLYLDSKEIFGDKELNEQAIVTSYIQAILEKYISEIKIEGPELLKAGNVYHLATHFTGRLHDILNGNYGTLLKDLHPTPAVCGMPLQTALNILLEQENFDRELYSGFLGTVTENSADIYVNLRCMQVFENSFNLYAGAGVVKGSDPENEWLETAEKMNTLGRFI